MMTDSLESLALWRCLTPLQQASRFATLRFVARPGVAPSAEPKRKQQNRLAPEVQDSTAAGRSFSWFAPNSHR
jgi:hypothetical protein